MLTLRHKDYVTFILVLLKADIRDIKGLLERLPVTTINR